MSLVTEEDLLQFVCALVDVSACIGGATGTMRNTMAGSCCLQWQVSGRKETHRVLGDRLGICKRKTTLFALTTAEPGLQSKHARLQTNR